MMVIYRTFTLIHPYVRTRSVGSLSTGLECRRPSHCVPMNDSIREKNVSVVIMLYVHNTIGDRAFLDLKYAPLSIVLMVQK